MHDETVKSYKWVIEAFLECMKGVKPETVITDGDLAMRVAISELMPGSTHRLCSWHIGENALKHVKDSGFNHRLKRVMFGYFSEEEFEQQWKKLIEDFGLENNEWAQQLYAVRERWADTYLRGHFFGGMTTTQRCEGMNYYIKTHVDKEMKMWQFVRRMDLALSYLRHVESKDDFYSTNTAPLLGATNMQEVEEQAATTYTRRMFFMVREEIKREGKCIMTLGEKTDNLINCELTKYDEKGRKRCVKYQKAAAKFECECLSFESKGYPCRHIFAAMKSLHMKRIPDSLILRRWTMDREGPIDTQDHAPKCRYTCSEEAARFGEINSRSAQIAYYASKHAHLFQMAKTGQEKLLNSLMIAHEALAEDKGATKKMETPPIITVRNPVFTKTKGTSSSQRLGVKGLRKWSLCTKRGHNKATCSIRGVRNDTSPLRYDHMNDESVNLGENEDIWPGIDTSAFMCENKINDGM